MSLVAKNSNLKQLSVNSGSGFFLFYVPVDKQDGFRRAMNGLTEMPFKFDHQGTIPISVS